MLTFKVLGPLLVNIDGHACAPSASKVRQVLALALLRANQIVTLDSIIEELWGDQPPRSAVTTAQTYIYQIRKLVATHAGTRTADGLIRTVPPGYLLSVADDQLDSRKFERTVDQAQPLLEQGQAGQAAQLLREALAAWNGPVLADVTRGALLQGYATHLEEKRMLALELRLRADMSLGRYRELIGELKSLILTHPYDEWLHAQLMIALHKSGRRGDALNAYRNARRLLSDELGLEPSADLQLIHQRVLNADVRTG